MVQNLTSRHKSPRLAKTWRAEGKQSKLRNFHEPNTGSQMLWSRGPVSLNDSRLRQGECVHHRHDFYRGKIYHCHRARLDGHSSLERELSERTVPFWEATFLRVMPSETHIICRISQAPASMWGWAKQFDLQMPLFSMFPLSASKALALLSEISHQYLTGKDALEHAGSPRGLWSHARQCQCHHALYACHWWPRVPRTWKSSTQWHGRLQDETATAFLTCHQTNEPYWGSVAEWQVSKRTKAPNQLINKYCTRTLLTSQRLRTGEQTNTFLLWCVATQLGSILWYQWEAYWDRTYGFGQDLISSFIRAQGQQNYCNENWKHITIHLASSSILETKIWWVAGRESDCPELLGSPWTSQSFPPLPRKFPCDIFGTSLTVDLKAIQKSPEVCQTFKEFHQSSVEVKDFPEVSPSLWEARLPVLTHKHFLWAFEVLSFFRLVSLDVQLLMAFPPIALPIMA